MSYFTGQKEYFQNIKKIPFEGKKSKNPLAFKFFDKDRVVSGKTMAEHLRFSVAYWHSFCQTGADPFGGATFDYPWHSSDPMTLAEQKADAAFEFFTKLGVNYYCFHDVDIATEGNSLQDRDRYFSHAVNLLKERQQATDVKLMWNTANLFSHSRYRNGAATNPQFDVLSYAAHQVKTSLDVAKELQARGYVFWGGREGYTSLLNTNMKREIEHLAQFLSLSRDYARKIGFNGVLMVEPKPMEPTKHQYDYDASTVLNFLHDYDLYDDFSLNLEDNHATLAGHEFQHEIEVALNHKHLDNLDINRGDEHNGWDTDQFQTNIYTNTAIMTSLLRHKHEMRCGFNFDAKIRRNSTDAQDLFIAHIGGMDALALGLLMADKLLQDNRIDTFRQERYSSFDQGYGQRFEQGLLSLQDLSELALNTKEPTIPSGLQEGLENILNEILFST